MTSAAAGPSTYTAFGLRAEVEPLESGLYIVATPIGNLGDISFRALSTLAAADTIVAEDTRVTRTLLAHYGITTPMTPYHEHNARAVRPQILARLAEGARIALVSDAGTPLVSDPGFKLVAEAVEAGHRVVGIPGASAVLTALVVAGLPSDRFFFEGFLPHKSGPRRARAAELAAVPGTLIFFEGPKRLAAMLADLADVLDDRQAVIARELTKKFEQVRRGSLRSLAAIFETEGAPKGEIVVLVAPPDENRMLAGADEVDERLRAALQTLSVKDAASKVAAETGHKRREVYARAIEIAGSERTAKLDGENE
ncbi:MAG: 16S rRNA (cytidine(1402)-2'-O)-methyltransferase [Hyphomicrobiales bacterium]|nr:16S rRNA (cytidine(1402)-2'-O)-methyltransferase [Hyphomicrobiales bacterium]